MGVTIVSTVFGTLLFLAAAVTAVWFLTEDYRAYERASELFEKGKYEEAAVIFAELEDYKDSPERLNESKYRIADGLLEYREYLEAAEAFEELGDYSDSTEKKKESYYKLAKKERRYDEYDSAYEHFLLAEDYEDAEYLAQETVYEKGHDAFLEEDYDTAFECFENLEGGEETYGDPHFITLNDAEQYLEEQLDELNHSIEFYIAEELESTEEENAFMGVSVYENVVNHIPYFIGSCTYFEEDKQVIVNAMNYYTGDIILDAWEKGDTSKLSADEKEVLELALALVEKAKAETDSDLELEIWLHDWLCEKITYENPDMNVSTFEFLGLRQLSCIGAMLDGKANCQGYTDAFYLLGNIAGFEVERVFGDVGEEAHVWNTILLDGKRYIVDVTFDDIDEKCGGWTYTYFNAPWDPDTYYIYGGADTVPLIALEDNEKISYYSLNNCSYGNTKDAARHIVKELKNNRNDWAYAVIENREVSWDDVDDALDSVRGRFGDGKTWWIYVEYYRNNTYVSVKIV